MAHFLPNLKHGKPHAEILVSKTKYYFFVRSLSFESESAADDQFSIVI